LKGNVKEDEREHNEKRERESDKVGWVVHQNRQRRLVDPNLVLKASMEMGVPRSSMEMGVPRSSMVEIGGGGDEMNGRRR